MLQCGRIVCVMKIVPCNVGGYSGFEKRMEVKNLVVEKNPIVLCIQETKLVVIDDVICSPI